MIDKNIIACDFGTKNIGFAVGQLLTRTAQPLKSLKIKNGIPNWFDISKILIEWQPSKIIVGLPLNMDGSDQKITILARNFAIRLYKNFDINVKLHDERLTSKEARSNLFNQGGFRFLKKDKIDRESAAIILKSWIDNYVISF